MNTIAADTLPLGPNVHRSDEDEHGSARRIWAQINYSFFVDVFIFMASINDISTFFIVHLDRRYAILVKGSSDITN